MYVVKAYIKKTLLIIFTNVNFVSRLFSLKTRLASYPLEKFYFYNIFLIFLQQILSVGCHWLFLIDKKVISLINSN